MTSRVDCWKIGSKWTPFVFLVEEDLPKVNSSRSCCYFYILKIIMLLARGFFDSSFYISKINVLGQRLARWSFWTSYDEISPPQMRIKWLKFYLNVFLQRRGQNWGIHNCPNMVVKVFLTPMREVRTDLLVFHKIHPSTRGSKTLCKFLFNNKLLFCQTITLIILLNQKLSLALVLDLCRPKCGWPDG